MTMMMTMMTTTALTTTRRRLVSAKSFFSTKPATTTTKNVDVLIIGGGAVGSTLANLLVERAPGCQIGLVDRTVPSSSSSSTNNNPLSNHIPHPRAYALSPQSLNILGPQVLTKLASNRKLGGMYDSMQIWESNSPATLLFSSQHDLPENHQVFQETSKYVLGCSSHDDKEDSGKTKNYLGAVVEDTPLVQALWDTLKEQQSPPPPPPPPGQDTTITTTANTSIYAPATILSIDNTSSSNTGSVRVTLQQPDDQNVVVIDTKLLVAADGANSFVRNTLQMPWEGYDYGRTAMTCVVELQSPMPPRAFQRFLPAGPLALLPTWSPHHATVVWSTMPSHANAMKQNYESDLETLTNDINAVLQEGPSRLPPLCSSSSSSSFWGSKEIDKMIETVNYGMTMAHWTELETTYRAPPLISNIASPPLTFPLSCRYAPSYATENQRVVLVGDAAHTVHPMAGQGLNLGLGDVHVLSTEIAKAWKSGMDVSTFVPDYQVSRQRHVGMVQTGIHTLHQLFGMTASTSTSTSTSIPEQPPPHMSSSIPGIMTWKSLGMNFINHAGPVRRQLASIAAGIV